MAVDKKIFKSILMLATVGILLVAIILKLDSILGILKVIFSLLSPLIWGIGIAFVVYPMFDFFSRNTKKFLEFLQRKIGESKGKRATQKTTSSKKKSLISPEMTEKLEKLNLFRKEQKELKKKNHKSISGTEIASRVLGVVIAYLILIAIVALTILLLVPQLGDSITLFAANLNSYIDNLQTLLDKASEAMGISASINTAIESALSTLLTNLSKIVSGLVPKLLDLTKTLALMVSNIIIGLIMSIYMVLDKDTIVKKISQIFKALVPQKTFKALARVTNLTARIFSGYISSRFLDSLIIGIICYICMVIIGFDYPLLISVVVGITNVIPVFGPFMGAIPSAFILFMIDPMEAVWFSIFILILQQIDGNVIGPKITGDSIGLPVIWTMIAILVGGGLFGITGMLFGVPAVAVVYTLVTDEMNNRIKENEKTQKTE